jgi:stearoyl-CoA desaturase (delta-9 desaturase)
MKKISYKIKNLDMVNTTFLLGLPVLATGLIILHVVLEGFNPYLLIPAFFMYALTTFSISGGYHRLFAHRAYKANSLMKLFYLLFGAASVENSALKWSADHRIHHTFVDTDQDPYDISNGFFFAHMGWILLKERKDIATTYPKDLLNDKLIMWQHNNYLLITLLMNIGISLGIGFLMGSPIGGFAIIGLARILFVHHITFCINSLCHMIGTRPYDDNQTARDSFIMALVTFGEGYHNFHHAFQADYRNGLRWYHWDPTKWIVNVTTFLGMSYDLKRASETAILKAKMNVQEKKYQEQVQKKFNWKEFAAKVEWKKLNELKEKVQMAQKKILDLKAEYNQVKSEFNESRKEKLIELKQKINEAKLEFQRLYDEWHSNLNGQQMLA